MDPMDRNLYDNGALQKVCGTRSHVIPVQDYQRLEDAVEQAIREVIGRPLAAMINTFSPVKKSSRMPDSQALLLWLKEHMPVTGDKVLSRTSELYQNASALS